MYDYDVTIWVEDEGFARHDTIRGDSFEEAIREAGLNPDDVHLDEIIPVADELDLLGTNEYFESLL